jgi:hypothetical protein
MIKPLLIMRGVDAALALQFEQNTPSSVDLKWTVAARRVQGGGVKVLCPAGQESRVTTDR